MVTAGKGKREKRMAIHTVARSRRLAALLLMGLLTAGGSSLRAQESETIGITVGSTVTGPIAVQDLDGNPVDLAGYLGRKPVLVEFWATWCPLCAALMPQIEAARAAYGDSIAVLIVAVGVGQSRASVKRHVAQHALPGTVFWDAAGAATRAFQAPSTSYIVTLDASGVVRYTGLGDKQVIRVAVERARG